MTDASQAVVWDAETLPFGETVSVAGPIQNNLRFPGQYFDVETGLHQNWHRDYSPVIGRYFEADPLIVTNLRLPGQYDERLFGPLGLQGPYYNWNRWYLPGVGRYLELDPVTLRGKFNGAFAPDWYSYANGNPLRWSDRRGLCVEDACVVEGIIAIDLMFDLLLGYGLYCALSPDHCAKPSPAPPPPPNQCQAPPPMPVPILGPMPAPLPWDLGKSKMCGCTCLKSNGERSYIGVMREDECRAACVVDNFNGYQCGGAPQFPYPPFN